MKMALNECKDRENEREKLIPGVVLADPQVCRALLGTVRSGFHVSGPLWPLGQLYL